MSWSESEKLAEWIEKSYRNGIEFERERIIKLLESMQETALATETDEGSKTAWIIENAKVLIKGENK